MACGMCPGYFSVWYGELSGTAGAETLAWTQIANVDSWTIDANVQEATKKRTSSTKGLAVKFCEDVVDFTASVTTTLCKTDWLFCHILNGDHQEMSNTREGWWFFGWSKDATNATPDAPTNWTGSVRQDWVDWLNGVDADAPSHTDSGVVFFGKVVPPGFGGDNTATDPSTATFSINISAGPVLPLPSAGCDVN